MSVIYVDFVNKEVVEDVAEELMHYMGQYQNLSQLREDILNAQRNKFILRANEVFWA